jgi:hypothetical protein
LCAIKQGLHNTTITHHSEKRFKKELELFQKERLNKIYDLNFSNKINTSCLLNPNIKCKNNYYLEVDAVLQYRKIYWLLENDETQHKDYILSCELNRMSNAIAAIRLQGIKEPIVFIRFNPDGFKVNNKTKRTYKKCRFNKLKKILDNYNPSNDFEILYMYYDTISNKLKIQLDEEWNDLLDDFVKII